MPDLEEKFTKLKHEDCSLLNKKNFYQLNKKETNSLNVLNEKFFSETLDQAYPFIADLLCINIKNYNYLNLENKRSKEVDKKKNKNKDDTFFFEFLTTYGYEKYYTRFNKLIMQN